MINIALTLKSDSTSVDRSFKLETDTATLFISEFNKLVDRYAKLGALEYEADVQRRIDAVRTTPIYAWGRDDADRD